MGRRARNSVFGPYQWGEKWTVEVRAAGGRRSRSFASEGEARDYIEAVRRKLLNISTLAQAIDRYEKHLIQKGNKPKSFRR